MNQIGGDGSQDTCSLVENGIVSEAQHSDAARGEIVRPRTVVIPSLGDEMRPTIRLNGQSLSRIIEIQHVRPTLVLAAHLEPS